VTAAQQAGWPPRPRRFTPRLETTAPPMAKTLDTEASNVSASSVSVHGASLLAAPQPGCNAIRSDDKTLEGKTLGAGGVPKKVSRPDGRTVPPLPGRRETVDGTLDTGVSNVPSPFPSERAGRDSPSLKLRRARRAAVGRSQAPTAGECRAASFAALMRAHLVIQSSNVSPMVFGALQSMGLARAVMDSLQNRHATSRRSIDGLSIPIRIQLSSPRACEGARPGPDAMKVGVDSAGGPRSTH
jgi:hypothetical protein